MQDINDNAEIDLKLVQSNVSQIILSTIKHQIPENIESLDVECKLMQYFLDLDLSVLGWNSEEYSDYA
jgi:predicted metal-dependent HD superfamily phosphohydrolase